MRATSAFQCKAAQGYHIYSHQVITDTMPMDIQHDIIANDLADQAAKDARSQHDALDPNLVHRDHRTSKAATAIAKYAGVALDLWPEEGKHDRKPRAVCPNAEPSPTLWIKHDWVRAQSAKKYIWKCSKCWKWAATCSTDTSECTGEPTGFATLQVAAPRALHSLILLEPVVLGAHPRVAICIKCGFYAAQGGKAQNLLAVCPGVCLHPNYRTKVIRALQGKPPKKPNGGIADDVIYRVAKQ